MDPLLGQMQLGSSPEEQRMLAEALRGKVQTGGRLSTSSLPEISKQGASMQNQAQQQATGAGLQNYRAQSLIQDEVESKRRAASSAASNDAIRGMAKLSNAALDDIKKEGKQFSQNKDIFRRYRPEFASKGGFASLGKWGQKIATDYPMALDLAEELTIIPEGEGDRQRKSAGWWSDLNFYRNNPIRHDLFGSALTTPERELWEASTINENMDEETLDFRISMMKEIDKKAQAYKIMQLRAENVPEAIIRVNYGMDMTADELANPESVYDRQTGIIQNLAEKNTAAFMSDEELARIAGGGQ